MRHTEGREVCVLVLGDMNAPADGLRAKGPQILHGAADYARSCKGAITSKLKHAIKLKTSPARLAQLLHNN